MGDRPKIGDYEVLAEIARGSFAVLYKCRHPLLGRTLAIKVCVATNEEVVGRFRREAEIAFKLEHPNIVHTFDFSESDEGPYLVQEYLEGQDLGDKIAAREPLSGSGRVAILLQIAQGLAYAHSQGVLHRDVSPANIRIQSDGMVKIIDFGIARLAQSDVRSTKAGSILGTAGYLPPEEILGKHTDERADIFSFGALAYHLLAYRRPFPGNGLKELLREVLKLDPEPLSTHWSACPKDLETLVACCLAKEPAKRYPTFDDVIVDLVSVAAELRAGVESGGIESPSLPPVEEASERPERGTIPLQEGANAPLSRGLRTLRRLSQTALEPALRMPRHLRWLAAGLAGLFLAASGWWSVGRGASAEEVLASLPPAMESLVERSAERPVSESKAAPVGRWIMSAVPWGQVQSVTSLDGATIELPSERITPLSLALEEGRYRAELANPFTDEVRVCYVTVSNSVPQRCRVEFFDIDSTDFFQEVGWWR